MTNRKSTAGALTIHLVTGFCALMSLLLGLSLLTLACAHTPQQAQHLLQTSDTLSNVVASVRDNPAVRSSPLNPAIEALCALAIAGLGVWNTYLHRQVSQAKNGSGSAQPPARASATKV